MPRRDAAHLDLILEIMGHLQRRLTGVSLEWFRTDRDEVDLTAFRLAHIGEQSRRLSVEVRERHPHVPWRAMYDMRNVLAHDYGALLPELVWKTAVERLDELADICRDELERLDQ